MSGRPFGAPLGEVTGGSAWGPALALPWGLPPALSPWPSALPTPASGYGGGCPSAPPLQSLRPVHQRHVTVPASLPQQQVFALAEPKRKPSLFWHTFNKLTPFRK